MKAIRVAVSAAGIAAMVAVVASGQMALVAADGELKAEAVADERKSACAQRLSNHV